MTTPEQSSPRKMRIVSLLASATEIVCALDAGEMLVGRSHECDNPAWVRRLPACSEPAFDTTVSSIGIHAEVRRRLSQSQPLYVIHSDLIRDLAPDLLITQEHCNVCAITPDDLDQTGFSPSIPTERLSLWASSVEGIFESVMEVADRLGLRERGLALIERERQRLQHVKDKTAGLRRPTVVVIEWTDPLFPMGNWGPELVEIANGEALLSRKGEYSVPIDGRLLLEADPEFLIVAPCGFDLPRALRELATLERYRWWGELQAVRKGNVIFADGNLLFNRSGMTITKTAEVIAEILHGVTFAERSEGIYWQRG